MTPTLVSWSGKDSAAALHQIIKEGRFEIQGLFTTVTDTFKRVSMHGVREDLLDRQAKETGFPLQKSVSLTPAPMRPTKRDSLNFS